MKKRAIISVSDKSGVVEFARGLVALGYEIISTGGTHKALLEAGVAVTGVSDITGFPECLDGRVKTLHPMIHAGILAMRDNNEHMKTLSELGVAPIDIVAINLYPFKATIEKQGVTFEEAVENIDIGGPTMIRAAAKNWQDVAVAVDPADYPYILSALEGGGLTREMRYSLMLKVFEHTAAYDALIAGYLRDQVGGWPDRLTLTFEKAQDMRYGENPHQNAVFYSEPVKRRGTLAAAVQLHGKELSFNNINDTNGALDLLKEFREPCVVAVKHANPCGVGIGENIYDAYMSAYNADPVSIFGGIVAANREIDAATAGEINKLFIEIVIAPAFTEEAIAILSGKKNIRLLRLPAISEPNSSDMLDIKKVAGGLLVQEPNLKLYDDGDVKVVTKKAPSSAELKALKFAMTVVKHTKSNAIVLVSGSSTVGVGPGQMNRIGAAEIAIKNAGNRAKGAVMASDAFFPFTDCIEAAAAAGVTAIAQPGGSLKDQESVDACDRLGIAMIVTGIRHFKH